MENIAKAILKVMDAVKGIEKTLDVGSGSNSYKGVSDQVVKRIIGEEMVKNGLVILPISVDAKAQLDRWEESSGYSKMKQSVFTEVNTKYLLLHSSGEKIEIAGYGQGVDSQDKSAGKATTYALKYALLYTFLVPTGKIDDADKEHSDEKETPPKQPTTKPPVKKAEELKYNDAIKQEIAACKNKEELTAVWTKYPTLKSDKQFYDHVTMKGVELK